MIYIERLNLIKRVDYYIQRKATGSPNQLAAKLDISRASVFRYIKELKSMGALISYCKTRQTYIYEEKFQLNI